MNQTNNFNPEILEVITGMQLGDSHITKPSSTNKSILQIRMANLSFVQYLWNLFNDVGIVGAKPYTYLYYDKRTGKTYTSYNFNTLSLLILATLHSQWYTTIEGCSIKILPTNLSDILTPRAIAFWVACDGSYHKRDGVIYLSTDSYTLIEVQRLQTILLEKFYINSTFSTHSLLVNIESGSLNDLWWHFKS